MFIFISFLVCLEREKEMGRDRSPKDPGRSSSLDEVEGMFSVCCFEISRDYVILEVGILMSGKAPAAIDCIFGRDPQVWIPRGEQPLASVLAWADFAPEPSRMR